jgi:hypothetical protein
MKPDFFVVREDGMISNETGHLYPASSLMELKSIIEEVLQTYEKEKIDVENFNQRLNSERLEEVKKTLGKPDTKIKKAYQCVYLMRNLRNNFIKIGISKNPVVREQTLQGEDPQTILIYNSDLRSDAAYYELQLHSKYKSQRIRGEWFLLTEDEIIEIINYLKKLP